MLESLGITLEEVRAQVARVVGRGDEVTTGQIPFTPRAKKVLELSMREALSLGHNYIGTEHILLGIVRENEGVAARILLDFDADAQKVRNATIEILPGAHRKPVGEGLVAEPPLQVPMPGVALPRMHRRLPRRTVTYAAPLAGRSAAMLTGAAIFAAALAAGVAIGRLIWG